MTAEQKVKCVDICCGLNWGDEGKGKIVSQLCKDQFYDYVCRWNGGHNAGHTIYLNKNKYKTHLIPSGIFFGVKSVIGPGCVLNIGLFLKEIEYMKNNGFDIDLIKISKNTHIITDKNIYDEINGTNSLTYSHQGSTKTGVAMCYSDKYARVGLRFKDVCDEFNLNSFLWDEKLHGNVLCEGAQGFWLDIDIGNYPYVTSSNTLPYSSCSLGFPMKYIRKIYGATKIYDTRAGTDPEFPETLFDNKELQILGEIGEEYGTTTGRKRKVNYLNVDKLITAINVSGTTDLIISKVDILEKANIFKFIYNNKCIEFDNINQMKTSLTNIINKYTSLPIASIIYSSSAECI